MWFRGNDRNSFVEIGQLKGAKHFELFSIIFHPCVQCKCWPGFHLKNDGKSCVDIDECSTTLPCSQTCINTYGSYKCLCVDGYEASKHNPDSCRSFSGNYIYSIHHVANVARICLAFQFVDVCLFVLESLGHNKN